jgi:type IX secretion system PorP/SprF family membrane protein
MKKFLFIFILNTFVFIKAQDIHFSLYNDIPTTLNPAICGLYFDNRVIGAYRNQWSSVSGGANAYQTYGISYDGGMGKKLRDRRIGYGFNMFRDISGDAKLAQLLPSISASYIHVLDKKWRGSMGLNFGLVYRTLDPNRLKWGAQYSNYQYNSQLPSGETRPASGVLSTDIGTGVHISYAQSEKYISAKDGNRFDAGFSAYHFRMPKSAFIISDERLLNRFVFYANGEVNIRNTKIILVPSMVYMMQGPNREFLTGMMFKFILNEQSIFTSVKKPSSFSFGGSYRFKDAIIPSVLYMWDKYAIGMAYDINLSQLTPASNLRGGFEVMLRYNVMAGYGKNLGRPDVKPSY